MLEPTILYVIRHAEPNFGPGGRICLGQKLDPPLSTVGREQAAKLAEEMKDRPLDAIYISPMLRAMQTADYLCQDCPRMIAPELTEVSSGEWDGLRFSEIYEKYPEYFDLSGTGGGKTPPGGETDGEALARGLPLLNMLAQSEGKHFALITHSGLGRILLCAVMGMPLHRKRSIPMGYASCTELSLRDGIWNVQLSEDLIG